MNTPSAPKGIFSLSLGARSMTDAFVDSGVLPSSAFSCDYCRWTQRFNCNGTPEDLRRTAGFRGWAVSIRMGFTIMTLCPYCAHVLLDPLPPVQHMFPSAEEEA